MLSPTVAIALVVVQHADGRFLLVDEKKGRGWYLPAGRVDRGEPIVTGAVREVLEETGIVAELDGILRFEHTPERNGTARLRVIFFARPIGGALKTEPDHESNGAAWVTLDEMRDLDLRGQEVITHCRYVATGHAIAPMSLLTFEGAPYETARQKEL